MAAHVAPMPPLFMIEVSVSTLDSFSVFAALACFPISSSSSSSPSSRRRGLRAPQENCGGFSGIARRSRASILDRRAACALASAAERVGRPERPQQTCHRRSCCVLLIQRRAGPQRIHDPALGFEHYAHRLRPLLASIRGGLNDRHEQRPIASCTGSDTRGHSASSRAIAISS